MSARLKLFASEATLGKLNMPLVERFFQPFAVSEAELKTADADVIILFGEEKLDYALKLTKETTAAILLVTEEQDAHILNHCTLNGILYSPLSGMGKMISPLYAMSVRLKAAANRAEGLKRRLDDSNFVNRAKMLLISRLGMSEAEAHRYIEKSAMDNCISKKELALRIIKTYEN